MVVGSPTYAQNQAKIAFFVFLGCFWAYVWWPHAHIGWATTMPIAINPTNPRTNPLNFHKKILRIGGVGKWGFCWGGHFDFFFFKIFFCLFPMKISQHS